MASAMHRVAHWLAPACLILAAGLAWWWTIRGAGMGMDAWAMSRLALFPHASQAPTLGGLAPDTVMPGMAGGAGWTAAYVGVLLAMWWVMMLAMMLPSAVPLVFLHAAMLGRSGIGADRQAWLSLLLIGGYATVWLGFSALAVGLQATLTLTGLLSGDFLWSRSAMLSAGVLGLAAAYQFTPLKTACLAQCQGPVGFLAAHWRRGPWGAFRLGLLHGRSCLGCCWAMMLILFVGGVMNLVWIAALGILALAERHLPGGDRVRRGSGILLALWAVATLLV